MGRREKDTEGKGEEKRRKRWREEKEVREGRRGMDFADADAGASHPCVSLKILESPENSGPQGQVGGKGHSQMTRQTPGKHWWHLEPVRRREKHFVLGECHHHLALPWLSGHPEGENKFSHRAWARCQSGPPQCSPAVRNTAWHSCLPRNSLRSTGEVGGTPLGLLRNTEPPSPQLLLGPKMLWGQHGWHSSTRGHIQEKRQSLRVCQCLSQVGKTGC